MLALIRGAGDIASGAAMRLWRCGIDVVMTDLARPTAIRRTVAFSNAIVHGETTVEGLRAVRAENAAEAKKLLREGSLPVLADPECACREELAPDALVDAILAKRNLGTKIDDAPIVVYWCSFSEPNLRTRPAWVASRFFPIQRGDSFCFR